MAHDRAVRRRCSNLIRQRPLLPMVLAFAAGIFFGERCAAVQAAWMLFAMCDVLLWFFFLKGFRPHIAWVCAAMAGAGWVLMSLRIAPVSRYARFHGTKGAYLGIVRSQPMPNDQANRWMYHHGGPYGARIDFLCELTGTAEDSGVPVTVRVSAYGCGRDIRFGDRVHLKGTLSSFRPPSNPGQFDFHRFYARRGLYLKLAAYRSWVLPGPPASFDPRRSVFRMKQKCRDAIQNAFDPMHAAVIQALLLGDRRALPDGLEETLQRTGVIHFFAISGLHAMLLAGFLWWLGGRVGVTASMRWLVILVALAGYAVFTGLGPAILRVLIMTLMLFLAFQAKRRVDPGNTLAAAGMLILAFRPDDLFNPGFQLSFLAVGGIVLLSGGMERLLRLSGGGDAASIAVLDAPWQRWLRACAMMLRRGLAVSLAAWLAVTPAVAAIFHVVSPVGILLTVLLLPMIWAMLLAGPVFLVLHGISPILGSPAGVCLKMLSGSLLAAVSLAEDLPCAWRYVPWFGGFVMLGVYVLLIVAHVPALRKQSDVRACCLVLGAVMLLCADPVWRSTRGRPGVDMLDVGAGNAVLLRLPEDRAILYDCGSSGRWSPGRNVVAPYLWHEGITRLDLLVLSHAHHDHTSGVLALVDRVHVSHVLVSYRFDETESGAMLLDALRSRGIPIFRACAGDRIEGFGEAVIRVLNPPQAQRAAQRVSENDRSLVLHVDLGETSILLTGDIEEQGVTYLSAYGEGIHADVIQVPHHGGWSHGVEQLVAQVRPELALVSNRKSPALARSRRVYELYGVPWAWTADQGAIRVWLRNHPPAWRGYARRQSRRTGPPG